MSNTAPEAPALHKRPRRGVLIAIIALCCGIELILMAADYGVVSPSSLRGIAYQNGGFWTGLLADWQPNFAAQPVTMFLSYGFLHAGLLHLAMNMITLWSFGVGVVERAGQIQFLVIYFASVLGGAIAFGLLSMAVAPMVGASGALFGLVGAWLAWDVRERRQEGLSPAPVLWPILILVLLNVVLWWATNGQLAWETHLGGALAGAAAGALTRLRD